MKAHREGKPVQVRCYSGYKADERPVSFLLADGERRTVENVIDQWHGEDHTYFKVLADDHMVYLLRHDRGLDEWALVTKQARIGTQ